MDQEKIGRYIAEKRKQLNMTQQQLADRLSVTNKSVSRWEALFLSVFGKILF